MKDSTQIIILSVFSIIWICKPIPYERLSTHQHQKTVIEISYSGAQPTKSNNFIPPQYGQYSSDPGSVTGSDPESSQGFCPKPSLRLGAAGGDSSGGSGSGSGSFDDNNIPPKSEWETNPKYWDNYKYDPNSFKNTKKEEECELEQKVEEEFNVSNAIEDLVATALKNQNVKNEYTRIRKRLEEGVNPVNIGKKSVPVAKDIVLIKGEHGRYLVKVSGGGKVKVLGMAARGNMKNINRFKTLMKKMYGVDLKY